MKAKSLLEDSLYFLVGNLSYPLGGDRFIGGLGYIGRKGLN